jgi:hypothetical protein
MLFDYFPKLPVLTITQLPVLTIDKSGYICYCSDCITNNGIGSIVHWNGTEWINEDHYPVNYKYRDNLNYLKSHITSYTDCFRSNAACFGDFLGAAIGAGSINASTLSSQNKPGLVRARSSSAANTGYAITIEANSLLLKGSELFLAGLFFNSIAPTVLNRIGFIDSQNTTESIDGCYFELSNGLIGGKTSNNSIRTTAGFTFTPVADTFYWLSILLNNDANSVNFKIFNENGSSILYNQNITTNIPIDIGRETGCGIVGYSTGTTALDLYTLDFIGFNINTNRSILNI